MGDGVGDIEDTGSGEPGCALGAGLTEQMPSDSEVVEPNAQVDELVAQKVRDRLFGGPNSTQAIGRYTVVDTVGVGGMGTVLRAFDPQLDRQVALKVLHGQLSEHEAARMRREAQAMAKLSHPNVIQVYEVGESDGRTFVAMELVSGLTVREWMQQEHEWRECVELFIPLGEGLAAAHERGLVHRDFKPGNALIDAKGRPRVLDFGLARQTDDYEDDEEEDLDTSLASVRRALIVSEAVSLDTSLTKTGAVMGTPAYMPPEQLEGSAVDARSDQFSFCVALYEALYGERPFGNGKLDAIMRAIRRGEVAPAPPGRRVPRGLRKILVRGLAGDPAARWGSMDELLAALRRLVEPKRQRWLMAGLMGGLVITGAGMTMAGYGDSESPCAGSERQLEGTWDSGQKLRLEQAFLDTRAVDVATTWAGVEAELDAYALRWAAARTAACEASLRGGPSDPRAATRAKCLEERRSALGAMVDGLMAIDAAGVPEAMVRVSGLPTLEPCYGGPLGPGDAHDDRDEQGDSGSDSGSGDETANVLEDASALVDSCPDDPTLALCLRFESAQGRVVHDDADPSIRGRLSRDARIEDDAFGKALVLPGKGGRLTMDSPLDLPGSFSIDVQLWMAEDSPKWSGIIDEWKPDLGYWLGGTSKPGGLAFWVDGISISLEAVPKEQWIHVVGTFDVETGVMSLYIDGTLVGLGQHTGPATPVDRALVLGWAPVDKAGFKGKMDTVRFWNRVLTPSER